jgi:hypothetical protein
MELRERSIEIPAIRANQGSVWMEMSESLKTSCATFWYPADAPHLVPAMNEAVMTGFMSLYLSFSLLEVCHAIEMA